MTTPTDTDLSYPINPDARGYAAKRFAGHNYYFGRHNTPESWVLFGEWRRQLIEGDEVPDTKKVKSQLKQAKDEPKPRRSIWGRITLAIAASVLLVTIGGVGTMALSSRHSLSPEEWEIIGAIRAQDANFNVAERDGAGSQRAAEFAKIMGGTHEKRITGNRRVDRDRAGLLAGGRVPGSE